MSRSVALARAAAVVAVGIALVNCAGPGSPSGVDEPSHTSQTASARPTPSATPAPTPSATPAPTPSPSPTIDTTGWKDFVSTRYGYTMRHPSTGAVTPASRNWKFDRDRPNSMRTGPATDKFRFADYLVTAMSVEVPADTVLDDWVATYLGPGYGSESCVITERASVELDGHAGELTTTTCSDSEAFVLVDGRMYVFTVWVANRRPLLEAYLSTLRIGG